MHAHSLTYDTHIQTSTKHKPLYIYTVHIYIYIYMYVNTQLSEMICVDPGFNVTGVRRCNVSITRQGSVVLVELVFVVLSGLNPDVCFTVPGGIPEQGALTPYLLLNDMSPSHNSICYRTKQYIETFKIKVSRSVLRSHQ